MKILLVASGNTDAVFVKEQAISLVKIGVEIDFFYIRGKGIYGYIANLNRLKQKIKDCRPGLIHAHFGLSGLLANLQRKVPVVTTYHGCDINKLTLRILSLPALFLSRVNIFVSERQFQKVKWISKGNPFIVPCGIDASEFYQIEKRLARIEMNLDQSTKYVLFSSAFNIPVKNANLAKQAIDLLGENIQLVELKGYNRKEVNLLMNACDVGLLTSIREGSPMFIKELLATNTPIVSTDVGDVSERIKGVTNCFIAKNNPVDIAEKLSMALKAGKTNGRESLAELDNEYIATSLINIYKKVINGK